MPTTAAQDETIPDLDSHDDPATDSSNTHDLIRLMIEADVEETVKAEPENDRAPVDPEATPENNEGEDLDLIRSMIVEDDVIEVENIDPESDVDVFASEEEAFDEPYSAAPEESVQSSFPSFLRRSRPEPVSVEESDDDTLPIVTESGATEVEAKVSWAVRRKLKAEAKAAAKAAKVADKQAKIDAKAEAKAARDAAKQAKIDAVAEAKAARCAAKQAKLDAAADAKAARVATIQEKADKKAEAKASKIARKQAKADAATEAQAARRAAKQAKADAKAEAQAAKVAAKLTRIQAKAAPVTDRQTGEIQKNVLKAVSLEATGTPAKKDAEASRKVASEDVVAPTIDRREKPARPPRKPVRQRAADVRSALAGVYMRLPDRPTRKQSLRATAVFVLLVEPWLVPIVCLVTFVTLTFTYFAMGPDRAAEITGAGYRWLQKRDATKAEKVRAFAQSFSDRMTGWIARVPDRWTGGIHVPDFSKDDGKSDGLIEDRFDKLAREARNL